jgi:hypothetical protein
MAGQRLARTRKAASRARRTARKARRAKVLSRKGGSFGKDLGGLLRSARLR